MAKSDQQGAPTGAEDQAAQQTGQQQVRLRINQQDMTTSYSNGCHSNGTHEEVFLDFGINIMNPTTKPGEQPEILFNVSNRIVLNYYTAKRLAISLSQLIRRHEDQFGELELDVNKRQKGGQS